MGFGLATYGTVMPNMYTSTAYYPSGFTTCSPYGASSYAPMVSGYNPAYGYPSREETVEERKERIRRDQEYQKKMTQQERERQVKLARRTLADLDDNSKEIIMKHAKQLLKEYYMQREVNELMSGVKWFLFFLGLAVLLNFGRILTIVQTVVK